MQSEKLRSFGLLRTRKLGPPLVAVCERYEQRARVAARAAASEQSTSSGSRYADFLDLGVCKERKGEPGAEGASGDS